MEMTPLFKANIRDLLRTSTARDESARLALEDVPVEFEDYLDRATRAASPSYVVTLSGASPADDVVERLVTSGFQAGLDAYRKAFPVSSRAGGSDERAYMVERVRKAASGLRIREISA